MKNGKKKHTLCKSCRFCPGVQSSLQSDNILSFFASEEGKGQNIVFTKGRRCDYFEHMVLPENICLAGYAGYYPDCVPCPPGTFSTYNATMCTPCPENYFTSMNGSQSCVQCKTYFPANFESSMGSPTCTSPSIAIAILTTADAIFGLVGAIATIIPFFFTKDIRSFFTVVLMLWISNFETCFSWIFFFDYLFHYRYAVINQSLVNYTLYLVYIIIVFILYTLFVFIYGLVNLYNDAYVRERGNLYRIINQWKWKQILSFIPLHLFVFLFKLSAFGKLRSWMISFYTNDTEHREFRNFNSVQYGDQYFFQFGFMTIPTLLIILTFVVENNGPQGFLITYLVSSVLHLLRY